MLRRGACLWRAILLVLLASQDLVLGQSTAGLSGTIRDATGAVIPGAQIGIVNLETGIRREASSNAAGNYEVPLLQPGTYRLTVQKEGFKAVTRDGLRLEVNQQARIELTMELGSVSETIEVSAAAPLLESNTSSLGTVVESRAVADLPLNGRNFVQLAILGTGVNGVGYAATGTIGGGTRPVDLRPGGELFSNGNRESSNNYMLDGVDNNFRRNGVITLRPSVDEVREFKIQTNMFAAEQGRNPGATVNVVTKSGSNELHGSVYEYLRNDKLDAREFFNVKAPGSEKPPYRQNQFGGTLGGPIVRNKAFFFGGYEGFRKSKGNTSVNTVPTAAMRAGEFSEIRDIFDPFTVRREAGTRSGYAKDPFPGRQIPASRFDSVTSPLIQAYPLPDLPGLVNNQLTKPILRQKWDQGTLRIDYNLSDKDNVFGRVSRQDTITKPPSTFGLRNVPGMSEPVALGDQGTFAGDSNMKSYHATLTWARTFTPTFLMEAKMGFGRFDLDYTQEGATPGAQLGEKLGVRGSNQGPQSDGVPIFSPSGYNGIGGSGSVPNYKSENTFNPNIAFTKIQTKHTLKWGMNLIRRQISDFQTNSGNGTFSFSRQFTSDPNRTADTGETMASFLLGTASAIQQDFLLAWIGVRTVELGLFVQDDWQVTSRLTLNLGLRYEFDTPPSEVADRWTNFDVYTGKLLIAGYNTDSNVGIRKDGNNYSPRFGFAYRLRPTTVLRGGFGIFYNQVSQGAQLFFLHRQLPFGPINTESIDQFSPRPRRVQDGLAPIPPVDFESAVASPSGTFRAVAPDIKSGYAQQFNFSIQHELPQWNTVLKGAYVGNLGRQLDDTFNFNQPEPGPAPIAQRRPLRFLAPRVVNVNYGVSDGLSSYHSMQLSAEKRFTTNLGFLTGYTYSHSIDNVGLQQGGGSEGPVPQDIRYRSIDRGNSAFDTRHRLTVSTNYRLPFGRGMRFNLASPLANALFGGWHTNWIIVAQSGLPFTPVLATSVSNAGASRPDRLKSGKIENPTLERFFDTSFNTPGAAWANPAQYTYGNSGRNILYGPRRVNFDFSVYKEIAVTERVRAQFRSEFFNLFNHPQFDLPNASIGSPSAGTISSIVGTPRDIQFSLRLLF
jgi:outer membrane receptor protein involved in Fe transport